MSSLPVGSRFIVTRIKPNHPGEMDYNSKYPQIGWTGTIIKPYQDIEYVVKWDKPLPKDVYGDLIRRWMITEDPITLQSVIDQVVLELTNGR